MKKIGLLFGIVVLSSSAASAENPEIGVVSDDCVQPLSLAASRTVYHKFKADDILRSVDGYGIYAEGPIPKGMLKVGNEGGITLNFRLTMGGPASDAIVRKVGLGAWYSIRREFTRSLDLRRATGIAITFTVIDPSPSVVLRATLSDLSGSSRGGTRDGMWLHDLSPSVLKKPGTIVVPIPFRKFNIKGDRESPNGRLNPGRIIAYEINLIGIGKVNFRVDSVECY